MTDDRLWKRRFQVFLAVRLTGLLIFLGGIAIAYSDLLREGGWPALGFVLAAMGIIDAVFAPRLLKRMWDQQDRDCKR